MRVWAVNAMNSAPSGRSADACDRDCRRRSSGMLRYSSTMLLPSGVWSAIEASAASRPSVAGRVIAHRHELGRLAVADRDRAGLVQQQRVDVAGHFDRLAALGDDVGPQGPVHAGDADGRQQGADRRGNQADQQGHQRRDVGSQALAPCSLSAEIVLHVQLGIPGHRPEGDGDDQEDQREGGQHQRQGDLVGRALADGPFDQGDHAIQERLAGAGRDLDDDAVGQDARAAGHAGAVAAGLADDRGRLAGDRRFVDRGHAFDDLAVAGNDLAGLDDHPVAGLQVGGDGLLDRRRRRAGDRPASPGASCAGHRPGPCRGPRPGPWRNWRTGPSGTARRRGPAGSSTVAWPPVAQMAWIVNRMLSTVPTSTTNITGFFHWMSGRSMTNDCFRAAFSRSGANRPWRRLTAGACASRASGSALECFGHRFHDESSSESPAVLLAQRSSVPVDCLRSNQFADSGWLET